MPHISVPVLSGLERAQPLHEPLPEAGLAHLPAAGERERAVGHVGGDDRARRDQRPSPTLTGATSAVFEPMKAPAPISVRCLKTPS